jgi:3-methyl-2-oxobutanoate hydroxymethyltransferase
MLGITQEFKPKFLRQYLNLNEEINNAVKQYISDVNSQDYPHESEQY